jgi:hypothetical protein
LQHDFAGGSIRLRQIANGDWILAESAWQFQADTWYNFKVEVWQDNIRYSIDDSLVFVHADAVDYSRGRIGLEVLASTAYFDNLRVFLINLPYDDPTVVRRGD